MRSGKSAVHLRGKEKNNWSNFSTTVWNVKLEFSNFGVRLLHNLARRCQVEACSHPSIPNPFPHASGWKGSNASYQSCLPRPFVGKYFSIGWNVVRIGYDTCT